jgi:electron transport complex protein RnfC
MCDHIVIENDRKDEWLEGSRSERDWHLMETSSLIDSIREAGLVGMGGAAFPTHVKLSPPKDKKIDTLVINGVECEPYLTIDGRMMLERPREIAEGIRILKMILGVERVVVGVESNKKEAHAAMRAALRSDENVSVELLEVKYPQGAEKQLIDAVVGREVPSGKLPLEVGVVVQNVSTAYAVYKAVVFREPLIERPLTITGEGIERPANLVVPIGISIGELIERQGLKKETKRIILGGPMMGVAVYDPDFPVVKGTSGILALTKTIDTFPGPCIRCGRCVEVCPMALEATKIKSAVGEGEVSEYEHLHVLDCVECGSCAFRCPARIPLVHYIKVGKAELMAKKAKSKT